MKMTKVALFTLSILAVSGCSADMANNLLSSFTGGSVENISMPTMQPIASTDGDAMQILTNSQLLNLYQEAIMQGHGAEFSMQKAGLVIDESRFVDPKGKIVKYAANEQSGNFSYLIQLFNGEYQLKATRVGADKPPVLIANIIEQGINKKVELANGETLQGEVVIPLADGLLVGRGQSVFSYRIGQPITSASFDSNFSIAQMQKGDISGTGYILLERNVSSDSSNSAVEGLFSSIQSLSRTLGMTKKFDYMLLNIHSQEVIPLNIDVNKKDVSVYSNCRKQNKFVNVCNDVDHYESLYKTTGMKNTQHYYWTIDWIKTDKGVLAFYNNGRKLYAIDVNNKQQHELFARTLGINEYQVEQNKEGMVSVNAKLGFSWDSIPDLKQFISSKQAANIIPMDEAGS